jgi:DNA-binding NtrC family response regulator
LPRITELLRAADYVAACEVEVVALLLPETTAEGSRHWLHTAAQHTRVRLRAGVATYPDAATTADALFSAALAALHQTGPTNSVIVASTAHNKHDIDVVVRSPVMERLYALAHRAGRSRLPILVLGETGSGKDVLARAIHRASPRRDGPFRAVNCGSLPTSLMESALFGHERGAFTGAVGSQAGLFEQAHGGTLFLDEIGELSASAQAALLRVLETKTVARVGGSVERVLDVRIIAATHRDLVQMCARERFREDLLYRLNAVTLSLPPLRERRDEIVALAEHFLRASDLPTDCPRQLSPESAALLLAHTWPGNVRELRNAIEHAAVIAHSDTIHVEDLPETLHRLRPAQTATVRDAPHQGTEARALAEPVESKLTFNERLGLYETELMRRALAQTHGHKTNAAKLLRMPLRTFMNRVKKLHIE